MVLDVQSLTKTFGTFHAVRGISFHVKKGEIVGMLGPNGAGKTTTIAMLLGLLTPTSGQIRMFDLDQISHRESIMKRLGYSSAYVRAPWRLKAVEHLRVFADIYELNNPKQAVDEMIETFKLEEYRNTFAGDLSAGNMAKLNLAKAFIHKPDLVLLDEPTSSLDPEIAHEVRQFLLRVQHEKDTSILLTSHNMPEVEALADRVMFINKGVIVSEDTPANLAKKIHTSIVELTILHGLGALKTYCKKMALHNETLEKSVRIQLDTKDVPELLTTLSTLNVRYSEITIQQPTLEDYFLTLMKEGKS